MAKAPKTTKSKNTKLDFHRHLLLNRWLKNLFEVSDVKTLFSGHPESYEGMNGENTLFLDKLLSHDLFRTSQNIVITEQDLRRYDLNIVRHWRTITDKRNRKDGFVLQMKYFQYLSLLFTEIYLDWYFYHRDELLDGLNQTLADYQFEQGQEAKQFAPFVAEDLHNVAFWNATGSGKTLLMHVNILQYQEYAKSAKQKIDKIIVLTPNEGLSNQHLTELSDSGFFAGLFDKNSSLLNYDIEIIEITRLANQSGDKTVAVDTFAGNNLVLVDEGHRGASKADGAWLKYRDVLCRDGFCFEYSATLGQVVGGKNNPLFEKYAKAILFDYSYKYFYADGYGKDSLILNIQKQNDYFETHKYLYLTACFLAFYQQLYVYECYQSDLKDWNIEKPLMVFVGATVSGENSDVIEVLRFLSWFLKERHTVQGYLADLISNTARLVNDKGNDVFANRFTPLVGFIGKEDELYADMVKRLMNADSTARLQAKVLKKADGEIALSVGAYPDFGVINIGDVATFAKNAAEQTVFDVHNNDFDDGLFNKINHKDSKTNLLIGSRKFTEGWSSWRVSTMGLLNMGKSEGSQIIQLFGRGVRLKGQSMSLKRSLSHERPKTFDLHKLETLNIFGINANYMDKFREYLSDEGIDTEEVITLNFTAQANLPKGLKLKTLHLDDAYKGNREKSFKRTEKVALFEIPDKYKNIKPPIAVLDLYPKLEALASAGNAIKASAETQKLKGFLNSQIFDLFDWDKMYLVLQQHKMMHSLNNLKLNQSKIREFAEQNHWYKLYIPQGELSIRDFGDVLKQQKILSDLLLEYCTQFYNKLKAAYEGQYYQEAELDYGHVALQENFLFEIKPTEDVAIPSYETRLSELKRLVESGDIAKVMGFKDNNVQAICFDKHLYYPIVVLDNKDTLPFTLKPLLMQENSERLFVQDLKKAADSGSLKNWIGNKELYLLRNASNKAKGLGFALAGSFYPDFLLWLVDRQTGQQWLSFIDPKGIRNMTWEDGKFYLYQEVKNLQQNLSLNITLNSFILSITPSKDAAETGALNLFGKNYAEFAQRHVLFMENINGISYLEHLFKAILDDQYLTTVEWQ